MPRRKIMNFDIIGSNISEAAEELAKLQGLAAAGTLSEEELQIGLLHAYHHLNFAWNIRHEATSTYASLTQRQFNRWGKYPVEIETL
ncbi:MAG TPA: hypothetical protein VG273_04585 [Bryobacteraceae bacterium]|jgi:hypothetical protein|nr:hypothetical protein [Bryobacteraceae bacterium]